MSDVLIFSGTTEGRELAQTLARLGVACDVCVATEYGVETMPESPRIRVRQGRLDASGMRALYAEVRPKVVVDATHPYAAVVTQTVRESLSDSEIPYLRVLRSSVGSTQGRRFANVAECVQALAATDGNILLTTGSKEIAAFCENEAIRARLIARVLPSVESITLCRDAGLDGKQIVAMQGPFTKETNAAILRQYGARIMVTKESGTVGGEDSKLLAAQEADVEVFTIARPQTESAQTHTLGSALRELETILGVKLASRVLNVALVGIGCGSDDLMTQEARKLIEEADFLFGAPRMLESVKAPGTRYPYYLKGDIVPILEKIKEERAGGANACVLFSGDPCFYSGCEKLLAALKDVDGISVRVAPGVSSIVAFAAKIGVSWQDAKITSLHGVEESKWAPRVVDAALHEKKTFLLTSGPADVRRLGELLQTLDLPENDLRVAVGRDLSYPNESIAYYTPEECQNVTESGLYVCAILRAKPEPRALTPELRDDDFLREKVPMTKEEARKLAICKLKLTPSSVVYDVGAGTGSIAIQCALMSPEIDVYAIEQNADAVALVEKNAQKFRARNLRVVHGTAPEAFEGLPPCDRAFIGGSKGNLRAILEKLRAICPHMRVVVTAVSMETVSETFAALQTQKIQDLEITQIAASRAKPLGAYHMLQANNPVFIFSFEFAQ